MRAAPRLGAVGWGVVAFGAWLVLDLAIQLALAGDPSARAAAAAVLVLPADVGVIVAWVAAARVTRADGRTSAAWAGLVAAMVLMLIGDLLWVLLLGPRGTAPLPSIADIAYLACVVMVAVALALFRSGATSPGERARFLLDASIVMLVGLMVAWQFMIVPQLDGGADRTGVLLAAWYLVADLVLLFGLTTVALRQPRTADRTAMTALAVGMVLFLLADLGYAGPPDALLAGMAGDLLFAAATACFGIAGLLAVRDAGRETGEPWAIGRAMTIALPYLSLLGGWVLLIGVAWSGQDEEVLITLAGVLTLLVVGRQLLEVRENQRLTADRARRAGEEHFRALVEHASDLITVLSPSGVVRFQTPSLGTLLGYPEEACVGTPLADLVHPDDLGLFQGLIDTARAGSGAASREIRLRHRDGYWVPTETAVDDLSDEPAVHGFVLTSRDIRERKALEERLVHQALHDPLTGLPNRTLFRERVQQELYRSARKGRQELWVLFLDIDDFKGVNDRLGHAVGDQLLQAFGERITACVRPEDMPARLGGDEFAIVMAGMPDESTMAGRAAQLLTTLSRPYLVAGTDLRVTASIGIAQAHAGSLDAQELLRDADAAMYEAKAAGRNRYHVASWPSVPRPVPAPAPAPPSEEVRGRTLPAGATLR
ncbi:MAG: sensor domain-containing diguanylate cyclase [Chloroflexota bacterium]